MPRTRTRRVGLALLSSTVATTSLPRHAVAFSMAPRDGGDDDPPPPDPARRDVLRSPLAVGGALAYGKVVADAAGKLARGDGVYPKSHETRVEQTFAEAIVASLPPGGEDRPLRVLEIGIGKRWRVNRRGLYSSSLDELSSKGVAKVELSGVDTSVPSPANLEDLTVEMNKYAARRNLDVDVHVQKQSITSRLDFPDGYFDCAVGSLVLCSVDDQHAALTEIKRLVRPTGGTFGYVEHVAVNPDEPYRLLKWQQQLLDPLQQAVADNCHLYRFTEDNISNVFGSDATRLSSERFVVKDMWPVSCQCCGVIQRIS